METMGRWPDNPRSNLIAFASIFVLFPLLACCVIAFAASNVRAKLTPKQARTAITRMAGFELQNGSVRVKTIYAPNAAEAEVSAEIRTIFKFAQDKQGSWLVAEIRIGQDRWEQIDLIANSLKTQVVTVACTAPDAPARGSQAIDPSVKRARVVCWEVYWAWKFLLMRFGSRK